jgi:hypothetical protein
LTYLYLNNNWLLTKSLSGDYLGLVRPECQLAGQQLSGIYDVQAGFIGNGLPLGQADHQLVAVGLVKLAVALVIAVEILAMGHEVQGQSGQHQAELFHGNKEKRLDNNEVGGYSIS